MSRVYDLAAEFRMPVAIHFEEGGFNSGFKRLPNLLKSREGRGAGQASKTPALKDSALQERP
jgi:hypothetical protein